MLWQPFPYPEYKHVHTNHGTQHSFNTLRRFGFLPNFLVEVFALVPEVSEQNR